jgi:hypothetical protein
MGWAVPPRQKQRHRVTIELQGPIEDAAFYAYRTEVEQLARKHGGTATPKLVPAPKPRAKTPKRRAKPAARRRRKTE